MSFCPLLLYSLRFLLISLFMNKTLWPEYKCIEILWVCACCSCSVVFSPLKDLSWWSGGLIFGCQCFLSLYFFIYSASFQQLHCSYMPVHADSPPSFKSNNLLARYNTHTHSHIRLQARVQAQAHKHTLNHIISTRIINDIIFGWSQYNGSQLDARGNKERARVRDRGWKWEQRKHVWKLKLQREGEARKGPGKAGSVV